MSEAYAAYLWELLRGGAYAAAAIVGVGALVLVTISNFKDLFNFQRTKS